MPVRKSLNAIQKTFHSKLLTAGEYWSDRQPADMGNYAGVVAVPDTRNMVYVRLANGQVVKVFNDSAPNIYNWKVYIGKDKAQPGLLKIIDVRWVYNIAQTTAYVLFHHAQHEYPAPDTVWVRRDQFLPLLVLPAGDFSVRLYGDVVYTPGMTAPIKIENDEEIDLSAYQADTGAHYLLVEALSDGTLNYIQGDTYASIGDLRENAPIPTPTEGAFPIVAIEFYEGQTDIRRDSTERNIIDLRMFTSNVSVGAGSQWHGAGSIAAIQPLDEFGVYNVADNVLEKITHENLVASIPRLQIVMMPDLIDPPVPVLTPDGADYVYYEVLE